MTNISKLALLLLVVVLQLSSCKKVDKSIQQNEEALFQQATAYLKQKQVGTSPHQSKKMTRF